MQRNSAGCSAAALDAAQPPKGVVCGTAKRRNAGRSDDESRPAAASGRRLDGSALSQEMIREQAVSGMGLLMCEGVGGVERGRGAWGRCGAWPNPFPLHLRPPGDLEREEREEELSEEGSEGAAGASQRDISPRRAQAPVPQAGREKREGKRGSGGDCGSQRAREEAKEE